VRHVEHERVVVARLDQPPRAVEQVDALLPVIHGSGR
jgi:hypothetical protein